jgi:phage host-nuclease inhibitor protein Gam
MSTKRVKKVIYENMSREQAEEAFAQYAKSDAQIQQITAKMDAQITKIREKHQEELAKLSEICEECVDKLQAYATENKDEFVSKKSMEMVHGVIGFRKATPSLKTGKGFTWASVTNLIKEFLPAYIRTKEEPNKEALLADREDPAVSAMFDKCGIYVEQAETFFVECKKEEVLS